MQGRTLVMGDIHGNYHALEQCLERCAFDQEKDTLIQLGDVVDGYSHAVEVVERLMQIPNLIALRGNHDWWCMNWLVHRQMTHTWVRQRGKSTIEAYQRADVDKDAHRQFFQNQQNFCVDQQNNRLFIHAGYENPKGPEYDLNQDVHFWDRELWKTAVASDPEIPDLLKRFDEVFIGHTPTLTLNTDKPLKAANVRNLDTGAGWSGKLTVMDANTKEYWQSDKAEALYKG